jgi:hypothetical protein
MIKPDLICQIEKHLNSPQPSERWAMYRLITPVVDFANSDSKMGLHPYFEFNQTSEHKTYQSVDIALLDKANRPVVMIEAKRVDRLMYAEQIAKYLYLTPDVRGVVTNGIHWILCLNKQNKIISILDSKNKRVKESNFDAIVSFIRGEELEGDDWSSENQCIKPSIVPDRLRKEINGHRKSNPIDKVTDLKAMRNAVAKLSSSSKLDVTFFQALLNGLERQGGFPPHLYGEVRSSRIVLFDNRITARSKRVARIELGKDQPDILVLTALTQLAKQLEITVAATPHDKGPHMRRFRLSDGSQASRFGGALAEALVLIAAGEPEAAG